MRKLLKRICIFFVAVFFLAVAVIGAGGYGMYRKALDKKSMFAMQEEIQGIYVEDRILEYVTALAVETRQQEMIRLGVSPRGALAVTRMARAHAYLAGRDYVIPEDVQSVFLDVCAHRIILNPKARIAQYSAADVLEQVLKQVKSPDSGR